MYGMRMARVNITIPDAVLEQARAAGLNISGVAAAALVDELDKLDKIAELDRYLAELEAEQGPIPESELAEGRAWADQAFGPHPDARSA